MARCMIENIPRDKLQDVIKLAEDHGGKVIEVSEEGHLYQFTVKATEDVVSKDFLNLMLGENNEDNKRI